MASHSKELKDSYRQQGRCIDCGAQPLATTIHCEGCRQKDVERSKAYQKKHPETQRRYQHKVWEPLKREVLTHYGKNHTLECCWDGCGITDLDVLTLDHIYDDGHAHRRATGKSRISGRELYHWAKVHGYPERFQTLCWNHQWKKRITALGAK